MKVREAIRLIEEDGWYLVRQKGSHRQFKHPRKKGRVTIAGNLRDDLARGTETSILKQAAGLKGSPMSRYLVIVEKANANFSAYSPDLPGCVATGRTKRDTLRRMEEAIRLHIEGLLEDGLKIPRPRASAEYVAV